jgi:23S rRNA (cytosine1962-C5)-methyltransferase
LQERKGVFLFGNKPTESIVENGITYALDLFINQDSSFYIDTRNLRSWLIDHSAWWEVLNTFAYTGSLGLAALAGKAKTVVQTDRNRRFLQVAQRGCSLNGFLQNTHQIRIGDFFPVTSGFRQQEELFDCVIVDPPFFSTSSKGTVDLATQFHRILNKVRPLIKHDGYLIAINNSLFLSGQEYMSVLEELWRDGYVKLEEIIPVPEDVTGTAATLKGSPPTNPTPFNHSTKIVILNIKRK